MEIEPQQTHIFQEENEPDQFPIHPPILDFNQTKNTQDTQ